MAEAALANWDVFSIGYSTSLAFDIAGVWSADPEIITLGGLIETIADVPPIDAVQIHRHPGAQHGRTARPARAAVE